MAFSLDEAVPWGRSFDEYVAMFSLSETELHTHHILGCGDGPAAFNAHLSKRGGKIVSVDPLYAYSVEEIQARIQETFDLVMEQTQQNPEEFVWNHIPTIKALGETRMASMQTFLKDYVQGKLEGRYIESSLPTLPFKENSFDLALCSHFLFLYSQQFSADFHVNSIKELCRVAREVRIFPLLELGSIPSRHVTTVIERLRELGYTSDIKQVPYEFQKGGNEMLICRSLR